MNPTEKSTIIVGLVGHMRSGKTTIANYLVKKHGFTRIAFADPLKEMLVKAKILTWEEIELKTSFARDMLQKIGTNLFRDQVDKDFWVNKIKEKIEYLIPTGVNKMVVDDVRFPNEYDLLKSLGALFIKVQRPLLDHQDFWFLNHESELHIDNIKADFIINNNGDLIDLYATCDRLLNKIFQSTFEDILVYSHKR